MLHILKKSPQVESRWEIQIFSLSFFLNLLGVGLDGSYSSVGYLLIMFHTFTAVRLHQKEEQYGTKSCILVVMVVVVVVVVIVVVVVVVVVVVLVVVVVVVVL
jgi:hypothetical protein